MAPIGMNASLFVIVVDSGYRFMYAFLFGYSFIDVQYFWTSFEATSTSTKNNEHVFS
jgi:hypothetical protein